MWGELFSGFAKSLLGGLGSGIGAGGAQIAVNKAQGIPSPATGGAAGALQNQYMNEAFPGSSTLDRLGIGQASAGVEVQKQQQKNQDKDRVFQAGMQAKQLANNKEVAEISARAPGVQAKVAGDRYKNVDLPQVAPRIKLLGAQKQLHLKNTLVAIQKAKQEKNKTALSNEMIKYKRLHALYNLGSSAPHVSQITGTGTVIIKMIEQLDAALGAEVKQRALKKSQNRSYVSPGKVTSIPLPEPAKGGWRNFVNKSPIQAEQYHYKQNRKKYSRFKK